MFVKTAESESPKCKHHNNQLPRLQTKKSKKKNKLLGFAEATANFLNAPSLGTSLPSASGLHVSSGLKSVAVKYSFTNVFCLGLEVKLFC